jgi:hypothetical protein
MNLNKRKTTLFLIEIVLLKIIKNIFKPVLGVIFHIYI